MDVEDLLDLVKRVAGGEDDLKEAAIGFHGYGFIFKDLRDSNESYVITSQSAKVCEMGAYRDLLKRWFSKHDRIQDLDNLVLYNEKYDCLYFGALKTLLPKLKFGGEEVLFYLWIFVKTPSGKQFPATFYFGPSGTALGGWHSQKYDKIFPKDFTQAINGSPFNLSQDEREGLIEALECALKMIPVSDFYGIYHHDLGNALMGVKAGVPFILELGYEYDEIDIEFYLGEVEYYKDRFDEVYKELGLRKRT